MTLEELLDRAAVVAHMRQARFQAAIGDGIWWVDPQNGVAQLYTRDRRPVSERLPIGTLGTEGGGEWLWAWANALNFPIPQTRDFSQGLATRGAQLGITELTSPRIQVDAVACAQTFARVALATPGNAGYVLQRSGPLTLAFMVGAPFITPDATDFQALAQGIAGVLGGSGAFCDAVRAIRGPFETLGIPHEVQGRTVIARAPDGAEMIVSLEGGAFKCSIRGPS